MDLRQAVKAVSTKITGDAQLNVANQNLNEI